MQVSKFLSEPLVNFPRGAPRTFSGAVPIKAACAAWQSKRDMVWHDFAPSQMCVVSARFGFERWALCCSSLKLGWASV